jgi:mRNA interferase MazF
MVRRGQLWWAELPDPTGSEPGFKRPVLVIQTDPFNTSRIDTVIVMAITSNMRLAKAPGNVRLSKVKSGLTKESVANVSQISTIDQEFLTEEIGKLEKLTMQQIDEGIKLVLGV